MNLIGCAHDSFLIEDTIDRIEQSAAELQDIMRQASRDLFGGFEIRADCDPVKDIVRYPDRFIDEREREDGMEHWNWFMTLMRKRKMHSNAQNTDQRLSTFALDPEDSIARRLNRTADEAERGLVKNVQDGLGKVPRGMAGVCIRPSNAGTTYDLALSILFEAFKREHVGGEIILSMEVTRCRGALGGGQ